MYAPFFLLLVGFAVLAGVVIWAVTTMDTLSVVAATYDVSASALSTLAAAQLIPEALDTIMVSSSTDESEPQLLFYEGGYGVGDNVMGLMSLWYFNNLLKLSEQRPLGFELKTKFFEHLEPPEGVILKVFKPPPGGFDSKYQLTHGFCSHKTPANMYEKLKRYVPIFKDPSFWDNEGQTIRLECNMPLFALEPTGDDVHLTQLANQVFDEWLKPQARLQSKIDYLLERVNVIFHARMGDRSLMDGEVPSEEIMRHALESIVQLDLKPGTCIYVASDTEELKEVAQKHWPQFSWTGWGDYFQATKVQHLTFAEGDKQVQFLNLERTLGEFMLFRYVSKVITQRWSNFSKMGLFANRQPDLEIWVHETLSFDNFHKLNNKRELVLKI
jgi:hypothetical protein